VIVCHAPNFYGRLSVRRKVDQCVVNRWIAVMIRFANDATVDGKTAIRETPDEGQTGMRADKTADVEAIEPGLQAQIVQFRFVKKLTGVARTAMTQQNASAFEFDDPFIRPCTKEVPRFVAQAGGRKFKRVATDLFVLSGAVSAATAFGPGDCLLLVVAGNEEVESLANHRDNLVAVAAAPDRIARECLEIGSYSGSIRQTFLERGQVSVGSTHYGQLSGAIQGVGHVILLAG
jgi:hypothetical protein